MCGHTNLWRWEIYIKLTVKLWKGSIWAGEIWIELRGRVKVCDQLSMVDIGMPGIAGVEMAWWMDRVSLYHSLQWNEFAVIFKGKEHIVYVESFGRCTRVVLLQASNIVMHRHPKASLHAEKGQFSSNLRQDIENFFHHLDISCPRRVKSVKNKNKTA